MTKYAASKERVKEPYAIALHWKRLQEILSISTIIKLSLHDQLYEKYCTFLVEKEIVRL